MSEIFQSLYSMHPLLPLAYLAVLGNGLIGPAVYCAVRRIPYDIVRIWRLAKEGEFGARYAVFSWGFLVAATVLAMLLAI